MMRTLYSLLFTATLVVLLSALAWAEPPPGGLPPGESPPGMMGRPGMMGPPAFLEQVFPPELVMRYQGELGLTSAQQETMTRIMAETQAKLVELQWKSEAAMQALTKVLEKDTVDETAALAQWDQLSGFEQQIKKAHLALLIRIKNQLTPSQQEKLRSLRPARPRPPFRRGPED